MTVNKGGAPKKERIDVLSKLKELDIDLVVELVEIAKSAKSGVDVITSKGDVVCVKDLSLAERVYSGLMRYCAPAIKSVELTTDQDSDQKITSIMIVKAEKNAD